MTGFNDQDLDKALHGWANEEAGDAAFLARLTAIPAQYTPLRQPTFKRALQAIGGWGFAAPQLAGLVVAAWLGFSTGSAALEAEGSLMSESMSAHLFGAEGSAVDSFEG